MRIEDSSDNRSNSQLLSTQPTAVEVNSVPCDPMSANLDLLEQVFLTLDDCHDCGHRVADALEGIQATLIRIADHLAPEPEDTDYIAKRLDCSLVWAAEMARSGQIPKGCVIPGTGSGKVWKFYRRRIEEWLIKR